MQKLARKVNDVKMSVKAVAVFLTISALPIALISYNIFGTAEDIIIREEVRALETTADLKVLRIEEFFTVLTQDMQTAQSYYNIRSNLPVLAENVSSGDTESEEYTLAKSTLDGQLLPFRNAKGFLDVILLDSAGTVIYTTENAHTPEDIGKELELYGQERAELLNADKISHSEIFRSKFAESGFEMLIVGPVRDFEDEFVGYTIFAVDMGPVYNLIQDTTGLGATGETLVGKVTNSHSDQAIGGHTSHLDQDLIFFINTLRHDPDAALNRTVALGSDKALPIQQAVLGDEGSGVSVDYRGEEVVAAWRYLDFIDWGLVAKIDTKEAFTPINGLRSNTLLISVFTLVFVSVFTRLLSQSVLSRLSRLTQAVSNFEKNQDPSVFENIGDAGKDEIGILQEHVVTLVKTISQSKTVLEEKLHDLNEFRRLTVDRELRMVKLKEKIESLKSNNNTE